MNIRSDIPMPKARNRYPWKELEVGDSFAAPKGMTRSSFSGVVSNQAKSDGRTYRVGTDTRGKLRVWRVK